MGQIDGHKRGNTSESLFAHVARNRDRQQYTGPPHGMEARRNLPRLYYLASHRLFELPRLYRLLYYCAFDPFI
jgi:hypothetical protein